MTDLTELAIENQRKKMKLEQQVKKLNKWLDLKSEYIAKLEEENERLKWWLREIVNNHRFTPISTAEKALKELDE